MEALLGGRNDVEELRLATDSQAAVLAVTSGHSTTTTVCRARLLILRALEAGRRVHITWVPGHAGIPENEAADQEAKAAGEGTRAAEERRLPHCVQGVQTRIKAHFDQQMQERWRGFVNRHLGPSFQWKFTRLVKWTRSLTRAQTSLVL